MVVFYVGFPWMVMGFIVAASPPLESLEFALYFELERALLFMYSGAGSGPRRRLLK